MTVHNFHTSLTASHEFEEAPFWREIYETFFPGHLAILRHTQDGWHQRAGIDVSVIMPDSKQYLIDEKIRPHDFGDILLEEISDATRNIPGWACKPLRADYICYAYLDTGKAFLLPVLQLQNAWRRHSQEWKETRTPIVAPNRDPDTGREWESISWGIYEYELFPAIGAGLRATFNAHGAKENTE